MIAKTQVIRGIVSTVNYNDVVPERTHIVMLDCENCTLEELEKWLKIAKKKYGLGIIYIVSDKDFSYRVWCMTRVTFKTLLKIILDCPYMDWNFFVYTVRRREATLRVSPKADRQIQRIVKVMKDPYDYEEPLPESLHYVIYETGDMKRGYTLQKEFN